MDGHTDTHVYGHTHGWTHAWMGANTRTHVCAQPHTHAQGGGHPGVQIQGFCQGGRGCRARIPRDWGPSCPSRALPTAWRGPGRCRGSIARWVGDPSQTLYRRGAAKAPLPKTPAWAPAGRGGRHWDLVPAEACRDRPGVAAPTPRARDARGRRGTRGGADTPLTPPSHRIPQLRPALLIARVAAGLTRAHRLLRGARYSLKGHINPQIRE